MLSLGEQPHRRYNALTGEWVLVSPHRTQRPWQGAVEKVATAALPAYDPACYLCPGNERAGGKRNAQYTSTFVFDNDFAALLPDTPREQIDHKGLIVAAGEPGICRVICFTPRHDLTLSNMTREQIRAVVDVWAEQYCQLGGMPEISHVEIFENRGAMMGASNPHPHCQAWATATVPDQPAKEAVATSRYRAEHSSCLLCDYLNLEQGLRERLVYANATFVALVPFWAVWPFETLIVPKNHVTSLDELTDDARDGLADILGWITAVYDRVFEAPFPYTMGFHQKATKPEVATDTHLHAHFYPPLLRSATVRKFMVGFEMLGTPQRDITAESAAARLREISDGLTNGGAG